MGEPVKRPQLLPSTSAKYNLACGNVYVHITFLDNKPFEVFAVLGKAGGCAAAMLEAACRLISACLRSGVPVEVFIKQLAGIRCLNSAWQDGEENLSCADVIAKALKSAVEK